LTGIFSKSILSVPSIGVFALGPGIFSQRIVRTDLSSSRGGYAGTGAASLPHDRSDAPRMGPSPSDCSSEVLDPALVAYAWREIEPTVSEMGALGSFVDGPSARLPESAPLQLRLLDASGRRPLPFTYSVAVPLIAGPWRDVTVRACSVVVELFRATPWCQRSRVMRDSLHADSKRRSGRVRRRAPIRHR